MLGCRVGSTCFPLPSRNLQRLVPVVLGAIRLPQIRFYAGHDSKCWFSILATNMLLHRSTVSRCLWCCCHQGLSYTETYEDGRPIREHWWTVWSNIIMNLYELSKLIDTVTQPPQGRVNRIKLRLAKQRDHGFRSATEKNRRLRHRTVTDRTITNNLCQ